jgi:branched-chain amino acid transport system ATP-binding protein
MTMLLATSALGGGYGALPIFREANLAVGRGRIVGVLGPNGAGKTTLLKTLAGLLAPQAGSIFLEERDVTALRAHDRARSGLALVPEGRQIFAQMSVRENLDISRSANRHSPAAFRKALEEVIDLFPKLGERIDQRGGSLSGGEQQMLAIARALLLDPKVLLLDEPTQGLAPIMVGQVLAGLQSLKGRLAMVVVEQSRTFLNEIADEHFTMNAGKLEPTKE